MASGLKAPKSVTGGRAEVTPEERARWREEVEEVEFPVLVTERGLVKGTWGYLESLEWRRPLPGGTEALQKLLIVAEDLVKMAERRADIVVEPEELGEGSFATVVSTPGSVAVVKLIPWKERDAFRLEAGRLALLASDKEIGPEVYGYGWIHRKLGTGTGFKTMAIFMERAQPFDRERWKGEGAVCLKLVRKMAEVGFHNDVKPDHFVTTPAGVRLLDFDLVDERKIKVPVSSSCIELDTWDVTEPLGKTVAFREFYDLFQLACRLETGHPGFPEVFARLQELWDPQVIEQILDKADAKDEVPVEVLVRAPMEALTVNLGDLRGLAFAHEMPSWETFPQIFKSQGVYWPDS